MVASSTRSWLCGETITANFPVHWSATHCRSTNCLTWNGDLAVSAIRDALCKCTRNNVVAVTVANKELHSVGSTFLQVKLTLDKGNNQSDEVFMGTSHRCCAVLYWRLIACCRADAAPILPTAARDGACEEYARSVQLTDVINSNVLYIQRECYRCGTNRNIGCSCSCHYLQRSQIFTIISQSTNYSHCACSCSHSQRSCWCCSRAHRRRRPRTSPPRHCCRFYRCCVASPTCLHSCWVAGL